MKKNYLLTLLFTAIMPLFFACSDNEDNPSSPNTPDDNQQNTGARQTLIYLEDVADYWDYAIVENIDNYVFKKILEDRSEIALGNFEGQSIKMKSDEQLRPMVIESDEFKANISYRAGKAFIYCQYKELMYCDSLNLPENQATTRAALTRAPSQGDILAALIGWALENGIRDGIEKVTNEHPVVKAVGKLLDFQRATIDMNAQETLNYEVEKYKWADWLLRPSIDNCPIDWLKKMLEDGKEKNSNETEETKAVPTLIIGLVTGNAPYIYSTSAKCLVDGYLQAIANDGIFDFDYGLCFSEKANPSISDNVSSKNIQSKNLMGDAITLTLPEPFLLTNLKSNTRYFYRAFFKDNTTGHVIYSELVRSFTTSDIPASISSFAQTNSYHNQNGYTNNGKTYSYKFMISLKAELESFEDIMDWGYYYINEEGNRVAYSLMSRGALRCDDVLEYYSRTPETTVKLGCYVKYNSVGDKAFYSDPQSYNLKYNDDVTLTFTDCNYIEVTHDNSLGYYRCGVTFDVSFKVQGSQNLTSIVILPYGNFLSWNAPSYNNPSDGDYKTVITDQYLYEYGLYGNFYCYLYAKDVDGKEYYSDNMVRLYHDGYHFISCVVEPWESLSQKAATRRNAPISTISIPRH